MENDFQGRLAVLEAAAQELEVRTRTEKDGLLEQLKRANLSLQSSEFERSDMRDRMLRVSEGSQKLLKELDSVTSAGYRALEHEKRNAFLVEEVLGQLQVDSLSHSLLSLPCLADRFCSLIRLLFLSGVQVSASA